MIKKNNYLELLWVLARTDFNLRFHGSYLGYFWTLLKPLALFSVLYVVFSVFMRVTIEHYQLYLLLGIMLWNFFAEGTMLGTYALSSKVGILKKIYFPRIILVFASTLSTFLGLLINLVIFALFAFFSGFALSWHVVLFLPLICLLYFFVVGISLFLSGLYVRFRDVGQIWEVLLQIGFWMTPIIYTVSIVPPRFQPFLFYNPMTGFIQYARLLIIEHSVPSFLGAGYLLGSTFACFMMGFLLFRSVEYLAAQEL